MTIRKPTFASAVTLIDVLPVMNSVMLRVTGGSWGRARLSEVFATCETSEDAEVLAASLDRYIGAVSALDLHLDADDLVAGIGGYNSLGWHLLFGDGGYLRDFGGAEPAAKADVESVIWGRSDGVLLGATLGAIRTDMQRHSYIVDISGGRLVTGDTTAHLVGQTHRLGLQFNDTTQTTIGAGLIVVLGRHGEFDIMSRVNREGQRVVDGLWNVSGVRPSFRRIFQMQP